MSTKDRMREAAQGRLNRFAVQRHLVSNSLLRRQLYPNSTDAGALKGYHEGGLRQAAEFALAAVHQDLLGLESVVGRDSPLEAGEARALNREQSWALAALIELDGQKRAKETLLRLTDDAPLRVCMGDVYRVGGVERKTVSTSAGELQSTAKGCQRIMSYGTHTDGGHMWPALCPKSQKAWRKEERRVKALVKNMGRNATVYESAAFAIRSDGHVAATPELETSCPTPWIVASAPEKGEVSRDA